MTNFFNRDYGKDCFYSKSFFILFWSNKIRGKGECISFGIEVNWGTWHCVERALIQSFSGPYIPAFGRNTEIYSVSLRTQSECGEMRTRKTPNTDTFNTVWNPQKRSMRKNLKYCLPRSEKWALTSKFRFKIW